MVMIAGPLAMTGYFVLFALVHSLLADPRFKSRAGRCMGGIFERWFRLAFVFLAIIMVLPFVYILAFLPGRMIYFIPAPFTWLMAAGQLLAAVALLAALRQTGFAYFLGLGHGGSKAGSSGLVTDGFYCHLRNPLFFFGAFFLWLSPVMT
ncbi:Uncharacterised protein [uncultured archaeon]|nr:Uncharacterised protein [uncultured archaeon]